jgi:Family of unknown function (DUF6104)
MNVMPWDSGDPKFATSHCAKRRRRHQRLSGVREPSKGNDVYFTDRGIEELQARRGEDEVTLAWLADQLRTFVDLHPEFETPVERLATWLARLDEVGE